MKNDFNILDKITIFTMLNDYIAQCMDEEVSQDIINEMIEAKEKLDNLLEEIV